MVQIRLNLDGVLMLSQFPNIESFSVALIRTEDLDPVYCMLYRARLPEDVLKRWMLAYWWFYNAGVASYIAESRDFFSTALFAFDNRWPRGAERRHFRSVQARGSIEWFRHAYGTPEAAVDSIKEGTFSQVATQVRAWPMFGPWITFKVADMLERVLMRNVSFVDCRLEIYEEPVAGAAMAAREWGEPGWGFERTAKRLQEALAGLAAPPAYDRPLNVQELETCFCKFKSHRHGHYPMGKDTREVGESLIGRGKLAAKLHAALQRRSV